MTLTPEERQRIYEEEKVRIESEAKQRRPDLSSTSLQPNVAGLLCYVGGWVSGIVFIILEQKNTLVRFHALQSIIVFGAAHLALSVLTNVPFLGWFFGMVIGIPTFILWIVLMVNTYQGKTLRIPGAADLADRILGVAPQATSTGGSSGQTAQTAGYVSIHGKSDGAPSGYQATATAFPAPVRETGAMGRRGGKGRGGRIVASSFAIAWSIAVLVVLVFFNDYIAYYHTETVNGVSVWVREPLLTNDFYLWLPIAVTAHLVSIAGHIMLLAVDKYVLREVTLGIIDIFVLATVAALLAIFPFDFGVFANADLADALHIGARVTLAVVMFGIVIGLLVRLIKLLVNVARGTATYQPA